MILDAIVRYFNDNNCINNTKYKNCLYRYLKQESSYERIKDFLYTNPRMDRFLRRAQHFCFEINCQSEVEIIKTAIECLLDDLKNKMEETYSEAIEIRVVHYAPKDFHASTQEYVVANNDRDVFEYLANGYTYWNEMLGDSDEDKYRKY